MSKNYFSKENTGGASLSKGIKYQDLVSIEYLFNIIDDTEFKEITFESINDFTIIFNNCELCVQVKNRVLDFALLNQYLNSIEFDNNKKYKLVVSGIKNNMKSYLEKIEQLNNVLRSSRSKAEKDVALSDLKSKLKEVNIDYSKMLRVNVEILHDERLEDIIKCRMYEWCNKISSRIDATMLYEKLITLITTDLRVNRGSLTVGEIKYISYKCERDTYAVKKIKRSTCNETLEAIIFELEKDIKHYELFKSKLIELKYEIENGAYDLCIKISSELSEYHEHFMMYYLWVLYKTENYNLLLEKCIDNIDKNKCLYYSNYYIGLVKLCSENYIDAEKYFKQALMIDDSYDINYALGIILKEQDRIKESFDYFNKCLRFDKVDAHIYLLLSRLVPYNEGIEYLDKAIRIDPNLHVAYFEKGKILRYLGLMNEAYRSLRKYLDYESDIEAYKEIGLCLLGMKSNEADQYLYMWLQEELFSTKNEHIEDGNGIIIIDIGLNETLVIPCIRDNNDFIVHLYNKSIKIYNCSGEIALGLIKDSFLEICRDMKIREGLKVDEEEMFIPCILKSYDNKRGFNSVMFNLEKNNDLLLNKDFYIPMKSEQKVHYREYFLKNDVEVRVFEKLKDINVEVKLGDNFLYGEFKRSSEGYFGFMNKVMEIKDPSIHNSSFNEAEVIYLCEEALEEVHIKIPIESIKIYNKFVVNNGNIISNYFDRIEKR